MVWEERCRKVGLCTYRLQLTRLDVYFMLPCFAKKCSELCLVDIIDAGGHVGRSRRAETAEGAVVDTARTPRAGCVWRNAEVGHAAPSLAERKVTAHILQRHTAQSP